MTLLYKINYMNIHAYDSESVYVKANLAHEDRD